MTLFWLLKKVIPQVGRFTLGFTYVPELILVTYVCISAVGQLITSFRSLH